MAEALGGSRKSGSNASGLGLTRGGSMSSSRRDGGGGGGGLLGGTSGMAASARAGGTYRGGAQTARPASAPRERGGGGGGRFNFNATGGGFGSPADARARVEESRQIKEAGLWGREKAAKRDLPAYWSVATYGQPFNDERLAMGGAVNLYQILEPQKAGATHEVAGPVAEQQDMLRKSLTDNKLYFDPKTLKPRSEPKEALPSLEAKDRLLILNSVTPYQRIHALRLCLDQNQEADNFKPWVQVVGEAVDNRGLNLKFWKRDQDCAIRAATSILENMIRRHVHFLSEQRCVLARAPASSTKDLLREAFWKVDPDRTGLVSMEQFMQVWQNQMSLLLYKDEVIKLHTGKKRLVLKPTVKFNIDESMTAALFCKYGFDKDGLMPYAVFNAAISSKPARLLGQEVLLDKASVGKRGLSEESDINYCLGGAKVIYKVKCDMGVVAPSHFDAEIAHRSQKVPAAHMWLEHVYGYAGVDINSTNVFFTHNTTEKNTEIVYYTGAVGVVFNKETWRSGKPSQRFFFGHDNDIMCINIHPNRRYVATGQQKNTGPTHVPYVCIWDVDTCNLLQKLDHDRLERSIVAVCFSGNPNATLNDNDVASLSGKEKEENPTPEVQARMLEEKRQAILARKQGGDIVITITGDDKHTVHVWTWMKPDNKFCRARYIPGWCMGPTRKLEELGNKGQYYVNPDRWSNPDEPDRSRRILKDWAKDEAFEDDYLAKDEQELAKEVRRLQHPLLDYLLPIKGRSADQDAMIDPEWEGGQCTEMPLGTNPKSGDKAIEMFDLGPGCNGTPPMVYGIVWNPLRPADGRKGSEFATYGVKHLKTWSVGDEVDSSSGHGWKGTSASFGTSMGEVENVLSACYVPARHFMAAPSDACILTGFASGQIGIWVPPFPTRAGSVYQLTKRIDAHGPGVKMRLNDGTQVFGGVRVIKLRADEDPKKTGSIVVSGGADGFVQQWDLVTVDGTRKDGSQIKGVGLKPRWQDKEEVGPDRFKLDCMASPYSATNPARVVALDCHRSKPREFIAGTSDCDIWEIDDHPDVLIEGQEENLWRVACHPQKPSVFATTCESGKIRVWDCDQYTVICSGDAGFPITGVTYSNERYACSSYADKSKRNYHIAVGSMGPYALGDWHKVAIMDADNLQPLKVLKEPCAQVTEIKYSPKGGPALLAAGSQDMCIYIYNCKKDYQLVWRLTGHSGSIDSLDWTLPITMPGSRLNGSWLLMATDQSSNLLFWDPKKGRKVTQNQRDAAMDTYTSKVGFNVMGIWPEGYSFDDINSVCASSRGKSYVGGDDDSGPPKLGTMQTMMRTTRINEDALPEDAEWSAEAEAKEVALANEAAFSVRRAKRKESADGVEGCGYIVTADDHSMVHLLNYPAVWEEAPYKEFRGHASHVMCVRFTCDDRRVISVGGHDRGIYQWRTLGVNLEDMDRDKEVMACRKALLMKHRDGDDNVPKPGVKWVALDGPAGRVWGPVGRSGRTPAPSEPGTPMPGGGGMSSGMSMSGTMGRTMPSTPNARISTPLPKPEPNMGARETLAGHWKV